MENPTPCHRCLDGSYVLVSHDYVTVIPSIHPPKPLVVPNVPQPVCFSCGHRILSSEATVIIHKAKLAAKRALIKERHEKAMHRYLK